MWEKETIDQDFNFTLVAHLILSIRDPPCTGLRISSNPTQARYCITILPPLALPPKALLPHALPPWALPPYILPLIESYRLLVIETPPPLADPALAESPLASPPWASPARIERAGDLVLISLGATGCSLPPIQDNFSLVVGCADCSLLQSSSSRPTICTYPASVRCEYLQMVLWLAPSTP